MLQPGLQFAQAGDVLLDCQRFHQMSPDESCGQYMLPAAAQFRQGIAKKSGHGPKSFARQTGEQSLDDLMCANNIQREWGTIPKFSVQQAQERHLIPCIVDDGGARPESGIIRGAMSLLLQAYPDGLPAVCALEILRMYAGYSQDLRRHSSVAGRGQQKSLCIGDYAVRFAGL